MKEFRTIILALFFTYLCCISPQIVSWVNKHSLIIAIIFLAVVVGQFVYEILHQIRSNSEP